MRQSVAGIAQKEDRYFVGLRKPGGSLGNKWEFPGGKVKRGETLAEALIREWDEELGVSIVVGDFLCKKSFVHNDEVYELHAYRVTPESELFTLHEHVDYTWIALEDIRKTEFAESDLLIVDYLKEISE